MSVGVWIKTLAGKLILGPDTQTIIATNLVNTGTSNGYVDDPKLNGGYPLIIAVVPTNGPSNYPPDLFFNPSLNRLSWEFNNGSSANHRIIYGYNC